MRCETARARLGAYLDGELDARESGELERHIEGCAECAAERDRLQALSTSVREQAPYYRASEMLRARIRSDVRAQGRAQPGPARNRWRWVSFAAAAAVVIAVGADLVTRLGASGDPLAAQAVASHVRSLMASHLTDVASTDQHTVKPWFNGKLDYSPPVTDLAGAGFPLIGGRLDYLGDHPVAALVYGRRQHVINLFVWPAPAAPVAARPVTRRGYHVLEGAAEGVRYVAVSDLNPRELGDFTRLIRQSLEPAVTP